MNGKMIRILIINLIIINSTVLIIPPSVNIKADYGSFMEDEHNLINLSYINSIIENLSYIVNRGYEKGRWFGSPGENYSKDLINNWMQDIELYTTTEQVLNETSWIFLKSFRFFQFNDDLENNNSELIIYNQTSGIRESLNDFFITPRWNHTTLGLLELFFDRNQLTTTFNETNLIVIPRPNSVSDTINDFFYRNIANITEAYSLSDGNFSFIMASILQKFESDYDFTFEDLLQNPSNASKIPGFLNDTNIDGQNNFVFIGEDPSFNPDPDYPDYWEHWPLILDILDCVTGNKYDIFDSLKSQKQLIEMNIWSLCPRFKGLMLYDFNENTYDMNYRPYYARPIIYINNTIGNAIRKDYINFQVNYTLTQNWNENIESYNVIGQINGTNPNKYILIGCLYDGWHNQASADSAVGIGIMLAIAKYFKENNITPMYTMKFVAFSGEEAGCRGAYSFAKQHIFDNIPIVIDLNQFAYIQSDPPQSLWIFTNDPSLNTTMKAIADDTNFPALVNEETDLKTLNTKENKPYISDHDPFYAFGQHRIISFMKENASFPLYTWKLHHRDGLNHTQGDCLSNINLEEVNATAAVILNITKYLSIASNCWFSYEPSITLLDSPNDQNTDADAVEISYHIQTGRPHDHVKIRAILASQDYQVMERYTSNISYTSSTDGIDGSLVVSLPAGAPTGWYDLNIYLYNLTGEIDNLFDNEYDQGIYANDSYYWNVPLSPPNDSPSKPSRPDGPADIDPWLPQFYSTSTTDPNDDRVRYQWQWTEGHNDLWQLVSWESGATAWKLHSWLGETGSMQIRVRARDVLSHPNYYSPWSDPLTIEVSKGCWFNTLTESLCGEDVQFTGYAAGGIEPYTWEWKFTPALGYEEKNSTPTFTYNTPDTYPVSLKVTDNEYNIMYYNTTIEVKNILADFNANQTNIKPNTSVAFNDTSTVFTEYHIENWTWDYNDSTYSYDRNSTHTFTNDGDYNVTLTVQDNQSHTDIFYQIMHVDSIPPEILAVRNTENIVASGFNITVNAEFFDNQSGINIIKVNITYPDNSTGNYSMNFTETGMYSYILDFDDTDQIGQYNYTIWVNDTAGNINSTTGFSFIVVPPPNIWFITPPTPNNNTETNNNWMIVNTSVQDTLNTSALIDWNRSLKGYWPAEAYNDTGVHDNSTYENFGLFQNDMTTRENIVPGKFGNALWFDGSDDYLDVGTNSSLDLGTGDFTFMVWEKSHTTLYSKKAMILTNNPAMESWKGYGFGVQNSPYLIVSESAGNNITLHGTTDVTDNTWHHIAYLRHQGTCFIYVDGALDATSGLMSVNNITNAQSTMIAYDGHCSSWCYFEGALDEPQLYNRALSWEEINASYNNGINRLSHNFTGLSDGMYSYYAHAIDTSGNMSETETRTVTIDLDPLITNVNASPHTVGFGYNVTISANITDPGSGVNTVNVNVTCPDQSHGNFTMSHATGNTYQYIFTDTWLTGQYNYTIWATDNSNNSNSSSEHHFHVSAQASMSIATLKDSYTGNQYINITDPPNPPENLTLIDRGLTWNTYYNASSGENILETYQGPVNYQEDNGTWTPINNTITPLGSNHPAYVYGYRNGNDHGLYGVYFKSNAQQEWPVTFTFNRSDDPTIHAIRSKLVGVGYVDPQSNWAYQYLQNVQSSQGQTNEYSITYSGVFTGTDVTWSYGNTGLKEEITLSNATKTILQNHPPSQYGLNDASSYLVFITKLDYQNLNLYNDSGLLDGNITISDIGVEFKDILGQFKCAMPLGEAYELNNETARQKLTYRIIHLNGNTYLLSGLEVSDLNAMTFPVVVDPTLTVYSSYNDGYIYTNNANYNTVRNATSGTAGSSATTLYLGQRKFGSTYFMYRGFLMFNTTALPSNAYIDNATLSLYKNSDYSSTDFLLTVQNGQPTYPHSPLQSTDYNKDYYSGNGGSFNTSGFGSGYNNINLNNNGISWLNKTGWTKLCLRSNRDINGNAPTGNEFIIVYANEQGSGYQPKLVINYRNQSKIKNTGSTNIKGYLLIQIQFLDARSGSWILDNDTINETSARTITSGNQLALDTIFNGQVRASDLTHGVGTYRVYTSFRDPEGNILRTNDGTELKAWWQFSKT